VLMRVGILACELCLQGLQHEVQNGALLSVCLMSDELPLIVVCFPQEPSAATLASVALPELNRRLDALQAQATARLQEKGFSEQQVSCQRFLNLRYDGTDVPIMTLAPLDGDYAVAFEQAYQVPSAAGICLLLSKCAHTHTGSSQAVFASCLLAISFVPCPALPPPHSPCITLPCPCSESLGSSWRAEASWLMT
jgi:hypothetical protein